MKENGTNITDLISRVTDASGTIVAELRTGDAPSPSGGPSHTVNGFAAMVNGGSSQQTLSSATAFTQIIVAAPGTTDYYELTVPAGTTTPIILRAAEGLPTIDLPVRYAVGNASGIGSYTNQTIKIIHVGTGDIQVSVSWSDTSDVDLHVIDPSGEEVFYGHTEAASGGKLDLDSNAACHRDTSNGFKSNENIVWAPGKAIPGLYTVKLAYWSSCNVPAATEYVITVAHKGSTPQIFTGSFTGPGIGGGAGTGNLITTFTY
jgi:hypothetical protein